MSVFKQSPIYFEADSIFSNDILASFKVLLSIVRIGNLFSGISSAISLV